MPSNIKEIYEKISRIIKNIVILNNKYGQFNSIRRNLPIDSEGNEIPWYTYSAIEFLNQIDFSQKKIFEYGSGFSSIYWAKRAKSVVSVDDNREWFEKISRKKLKNQNIYLKSNKSEYINSVGSFKKTFDVIIIDGNYRKECAKKAIKVLRKGGFIILDNSDWFSNTAKSLRESGLIQVDFMGFGPINGYTWVTSLFLTREYNFCSKGRQPSRSIGGITNEED